MHVGITRCVLSLAGAHISVGVTYYSDQEAGGAVVMKFIFKERNLGVEQYGIWAGELGHGDVV